MLYIMESGTHVFSDPHHISIDTPIGSQLALRNTNLERLNADKAVQKFGIPIVYRFLMP